MKNKGKQYLGALYCIIAAVVWGLSFVAQSIGMESVGTFTFNACRMLLGSVVLLPLIALRGRGNEKPDEQTKKAERKELIKAGFICGFILFVSSCLQQQAFAYLEVGKVGFITALYMVLVPVFNLFAGKKASLNVWIGVALGAVGLYLLCVGDGGFSLETGDALTLCCAVGFAFHIIALDKFSKTTDPMKLSSMQFFVSGAFSTVFMLIFEEPTVSALSTAAPSIIYAGVMSCGVAFTLQAFGQKYTDPAVASLLLCLESAFSLLFGWLLLHQTLGKKALIGCAVMLTAVILTQIQITPKRKKIS